VGLPFNFLAEMHFSRSPSFSPFLSFRLFYRYRCTHSGVSLPPTLREKFSGLFFVSAILPQLTGSTASCIPFLSVDARCTSSPSSPPVALSLLLFVRERLPGFCPFLKCCPQTEASPRAFLQILFWLALSFS